MKSLDEQARGGPENTGLIKNKHLQEPPNFRARLAGLFLLVALGGPN
jgi:hypothetical protein